MASPLTHPTLLAEGVAGKAAAMFQVCVGILVVAWALIVETKTSVAAASFQMPDEKRIGLVRSIGDLKTRSCYYTFANRGQATDKERMLIAETDHEFARNARLDDPR